MDPIYLDHNATTPINPQVLDAMLPYLRSEFGNPSSAYGLGRRAHAAVECARAQVAELIGAEPDEIVFTGSATEATNIAVRGAARLDPARPGIVTTNIEHPATDACCRLLQQAGHKIEQAQLDVDLRRPRGGGLPLGAAQRFPHGVMLRASGVAKARKSRISIEEAPGAGSLLPDARCPMPDCRCPTSESLTR